MSDEVVVGIFTLLGTIFGTILGFCLTKLSDYNREKREKRECQLRFLFKLTLISAAIKKIKMDAEALEKITNQNDLNKIRKNLKKINITDEYSKLEPLFEKFVIPDIEKTDLFVDFRKLHIFLNDLLTIIEIESNNFGDMKPKMVAISTKILEIIQNMNELMCTELDEDKK